MGAQKLDPKGRNYDPVAHDNESPVRRVKVSPFLIGRYPVTVFEYDRFIADGGYAEEEFWKPVDTDNSPCQEVGGGSFAIQTARWLR